MSEPQPVSARGLLVPADLRRRVETREVTLTSAALSDLLGGGLLDESLHAAFDGHGYVVYLNEQRVELDLPVNDRAVVLSARLGIVDRTWMRDLRGDALFLGADQHRNDEDVPRAVLDLARAAGVLPSLEPRFLPPSHQRPASGLLVSGPAVAGAWLPVLRQRRHGDEAPDRWF